MYFQKREGEDESEYAAIYGLYLALLRLVCVNRLQFMDYILLYDTFTCECVQQLYRLTIFNFYFSYLLCRRLPHGGRELRERERERERVNRLQFRTISGCITHLCVCVHLDAR